SFGRRAPAQSQAQRVRPWEFAGAVARRLKALPMGKFTWGLHLPLTRIALERGNCCRDIGGRFKRHPRCPAGADEACIREHLLDEWTEAAQDELPLLFHQLQAQAQKRPDAATAQFLNPPEVEDNPAGIGFGYRGQELLADAIG